MHKPNSNGSAAAGFSFLELIISMAVTLIVMGAASTLIGHSFNIKSRSDAQADALADAQRAVNIMSREISNAGYDLLNNGLVVGDSDSTAIRVRANLNKFDATASAASRAGVVDTGEDIKYQLFINNPINTSYLVRYDVNAPAASRTTVLANRIDSLKIHYFAAQVTYSLSGCDISSPSASEVTVDKAKYVVLAVCVQLPQVGVSGQPGYMAATQTLLTTDVALRNNLLKTY